ncbi:MAG: hypothetical protein HWE20_07085 [Gammaproteobacteria bacterium]|nr:hypothetical protein [Gammaproteobacteria bacterium]
MPKFNLASHIGYRADPLFESSATAQAWLPMGTAELLRGDAKVLGNVVRRLFQAELQPHLEIFQTALNTADGKQLVIKPAFTIDHFAADTDLVLKRAPDVYFLCLFYTEQEGELNQWLDEIEFEGGEDEDVLLRLRELLAKWRKAQCDTAGQFSAEATMPSPAKKDQRSAFEQLETEVHEWSTALAKHGHRHQGASLQNWDFRVPLPEPIAVEVDAPDEVTEQAVVEENAPVKKRFRLKGWREWLTAFGILLGGAAAMAALALLGFWAWIYTMEYRPAADGRRVQTIATIYNAQRLFITDRARQLVMQSPNVFEDFIEELDLLTQSATNVDEYQVLIDSLDTYADAWAYRRDLYEQALVMAKDLEFSPLPVQEIILTIDEEPVPLILDHLDMREDTRSQILARLRDDWTRSQSVVTRISKMQRMLQTQSS